MYGIVRIGNCMIPYYIFNAQNKPIYSQLILSKVLFLKKIITIIIWNDFFKNFEKIFFWSLSNRNYIHLLEIMSLINYFKTLIKLFLN